MSAPVAATTAEDPLLRTRLRRQRALVGLVVLVVLVVGLLAWAGGQRSTGALDPIAVDPSGSRALARVLEGQGVQVVRVDTAQGAADALREAPAATLLITVPELVTGPMADAVASAPMTRVVAIGATPGVAGPWAAVAPEGSQPVQDRAPGCTWPVAVRAGSATMGGAVLPTPAGAGERCYDGSALDLPPAEGHVATTVLGSGAPLTNAELAVSGNASLATGTLGRDPVLVWWLPSFADPLYAAGGQPQELSALLPAWVPWALLQLAVAVLVVAYVRGRRFGPVVTEPLPVTVRAAETTEGLARMYRRAHGRTHAAGLLATEATHRLVAVLRLPRGSDVAVVAHEVAARTGRPVGDVLHLLDHPAPADDAALVRFAHDLDTLERQVRLP